MKRVYVCVCAFMGSPKGFTCHPTLAVMYMRRESHGELVSHSKPSKLHYQHHFIRGQEVKTSKYVRYDTEYKGEEGSGVGQTSGIK